MLLLIANRGRSRLKHAAIWTYPYAMLINWMYPVQGKSPLVQVKEHYGNFDMVTCRL